MAKPAKSIVKPFQIDWPRSYWWGLRKAPITLAAAGVDNPQRSHAASWPWCLIVQGQRLCLGLVVSPWEGAFRGSFAIWRLFFLKRTMTQAPIRTVAVHQATDV
jgi:hypothetical protein